VPGIDPDSVLAFLVVLGMFVAGLAAWMQVPRSRRMNGGFRPRSPAWVACCCLVAAVALVVFAGLFLDTGGDGMSCHSGSCRGMSGKQIMWILVLSFVFVADCLAIFAWDVWRTRNDPVRGARWGEKP
jgi:hypothetical protein